MGKRNRLRVEQIRAGTEAPLFPSPEARREEREAAKEKARQLREVMRRHPSFSPSIAISRDNNPATIKEVTDETIRSSKNTEQNNQGK